ncbi:hypothetical protein HDU81_010696 [Chytriomyces hyalinus]|nr:hypothetical protein HDU81_010696 [Chytriomyces hyalinus]
MFGRLISLAFEASLASAAFAGASQASGLKFNEKTIENDQLRAAVSAYLGVGEWVIGFGASQMKSHPDYFDCSHQLQLMDPVLYIVLHCSLFWLSLFVELHVAQVYSNEAQRSPIRFIVHLHNSAYILQMIFTLCQCTAASDPMVCHALAYSNVVGHVLQIYFSKVYIVQALFLLASTRTKVTITRACIICVPSLAAVLRVYDMQITSDPSTPFNVCDYTLSNTGALISTAIWGSYGLFFMVFLAFVRQELEKLPLQASRDTNQSVRLSLFLFIFKYRIVILVLTIVGKALVDVLSRPWPSVRMLLINAFLFVDFLLLNTEVFMVKTAKVPDARGEMKAVKRGSSA